MPFGVEMLNLLAMETLGDWWLGALAGQLLVALFAPSTAVMIAGAIWTRVSPRAAWLGALVYLTTPWVYRLAVTPFVEGPLCFYHAALIAVFLRACAAEASASHRLWTVAGLLAGGAMACKYPALVSAVLPFGLAAVVDAVRRGSWRPALAFVAGSGAVMCPWLIKNAIDTQNPVYPLAYAVFDGRHWDAELDARWWHAHGPQAITLRALVVSLVDIAGRSDWQSPLYVALAPLAMVRRGSRGLTLALWAYAVYLFATWWLLTHRLDRFWIPILPVLAALAGIGADAIKRPAWSAALALILAVSILSNLTYISTILCGFNGWTGDYRVLRVEIPATINPALAGLNAALSPGSKVLLVGQAAVFFLEHPLVYNTVFNRETIETLSRDRSPDQVRQALRQRGITHVYVDWAEIERFRSPGQYGFTPYVTAGLFRGLARGGALEPPVPIGLRQNLYRVR
jgi:hypothetical protein